LLIYCTCSRKPVLHCGRASPLEILFEPLGGLIDVVRRAEVLIQIRVILFKVNDRILGAGHRVVNVEIILLRPVHKPGAAIQSLARVIVPLEPASGSSFVAAPAAAL
jgi:hypothetical protein